MELSHKKPLGPCHGQVNILKCNIRVKTLKMQLPNQKETIFENDAARWNYPIYVEIVNSSVQLAIRWNEVNELTKMP